MGNLFFPVLCCIYQLKKNFFIFHNALTGNGAVSIAISTTFLPIYDIASDVKSFAILNFSLT